MMLWHPAQARPVRRAGPVMTATRDGGASHPHRGQHPLRRSSEATCRRERASGRRMSRRASARAALPVREALRMLEAEGLVTLVANTGAWVSRLSLAECVEIYQIRERIEPLLLRYAIPHLSGSPDRPALGARDADGGVERRRGVPAPATASSTCCRTRVPGPPSSATWSTGCGTRRSTTGARTRGSSTTTGGGSSTTSTTCSRDPARR